MIKLYWIKTQLLEKEDLYTRLYEAVSESRREKIDKINNEQGKRESLAAGFLLMHALRQQGISYKDAEVVLGEHGKPYLSQTGDVYYNLSHSRQIAVCAISDAEVGVDTETVREKNPSDSMLRKVLTEEEGLELDKPKDEAKRRELFYKLWTVKESVMKQSGRGIGQDPKTINGVSLIDNDLEWKNCNGKKVKTFPLENGFVSICSEEEKEVQIIPIKEEDL